MTPTTGFFLHPAAPRHDTGWRHPEHQGRLRALSAWMEKSTPELLGRVQDREIRDATLEDLRRVHSEGQIERIRSAVRLAREEDSPVSLDADTVVSAASWDAVLGSSGAAITACGEVADSVIRNAFVAARPPGHHATPDRSMGFCLVNNIAVAARWLRAAGRSDRVAIVDWDVHHGNGTQDAFYADPEVFYLSLHQSPHYPGTGGVSETGAGSGEGTTLNVPLPPGVPRQEYLDAFAEAMAKLKEAFRPDFLLVSAGFDVLAGDPLGGQLLQPEDLGLMTRDLVDWADDAFEGRMVVMLEGGYVPERLGAGVIEVLRALIRARSGEESEESQ